MRCSSLGYRLDLHTAIHESAAKEIELTQPVLCEGQRSCLLSCCLRRTPRSATTLDLSWLQQNRRKSLRQQGQSGKYGQATQGSLPLGPLGSRFLGHELCFGKPDQNILCESILLICNPQQDQIHA